MKKIVSFALALALVLSMQIVAFAEEGVSTGTYTADVTGTTVEGSTGGALYSVDITWPSLSFTYYEEIGESWDPENHTGVPGTPAHWTGGGDITITNHSNRVIRITPIYTAEKTYSDAKILFDTTELLVDTAANGNEAKSETIHISAVGSLPTGTNAQKIGAISLTVTGRTDLLEDVNHYTDDSQYDYDFYSQLSADTDDIAANNNMYHYNNKISEEEYTEAKRLGDIADDANSNYTGGNGTAAEWIAAYIDFSNYCNQLNAKI